MSCCFDWLLLLKPGKMTYLDITGYTDQCYEVFNVFSYVWGNSYARAIQLIDSMVHIKKLLYFHHELVY